MLRFELSGKRYEYNPDHEKLTYNELALVRRVIGSDRLLTMFDRLAQGVTGALSVLDLVDEIVLTAYIAQRRAGGTVSWEDFGDSVSPTTFRPIASDERPVTVGVSPDLGQQVPAPEASVSPTLAAMHQPAPAAPHEGLPDLYRAP